ncbi:MAG: hypothetical protein ACOVKC_00265 [Brevundimonas sp.]
MYAYARKNVGPDCPWFGEGSLDEMASGGEGAACTIEEVVDADDTGIQFARWRKHPDLHDWMETLAIERGFRGQFNCVWLRLTPQDIDRLQADMDEGLARSGGGFFFGESSPEKEAYTRRFIKGARHAFRKGATIFYDSWW